MNNTTNNFDQTLTTKLATEEAIKRVVNDAVYLQVSINVYPEMLETPQNL
jgi:hypothetical protein